VIETLFFIERPRHRLGFVIVCAYGAIRILRRPWSSQQCPAGEILVRHEAGQLPVHHLLFVHRSSGRQIGVFDGGFVKYAIIDPGIESRPGRSASASSFSIGLRPSLKGEAYGVCAAATVVVVARCFILQLPHLRSSALIYRPSPLGLPFMVLLLLFVCIHRRICREMFKPGLGLR